MSPGDTLNCPRFREFEMSTGPSLIQRLDRAQEAVVRFLCDSTVGYGVVIVLAILTGLFGVQRPVLLWLGGAVAVLVVGLRIFAGLRSRPGGPRGRKRAKERPWAYTPLATRDGDGATAPVRFSRAQLRATLEGSIRSDGAVALYVPAYGKTFRLMVDPDEEPNPPSAGTVKTVNNVLRWSDVQRARIRELLVADAEAAGADVTIDTVEDIVSGGGLGIGEGHGEKSRLATLHLHAPWGHQGSVEIVIRDGEPIALGGRYLELDAYDAAYD